MDSKDENEISISLRDLLASRHNEECAVKLARIISEQRDKTYEDLRLERKLTSYLEQGKRDLELLLNDRLYRIRVLADLLREVMRPHGIYDQAIATASPAFSDLYMNTGGKIKKELAANPGD